MTNSNASNAKEAMSHTHTKRRRGFTLTELLVALAIFALGGTAIMSLFLTNIRLSRQAMDYTRAAEITRNVRSLLTSSMSRPIILREAIPGQPDSETISMYQFYYPGTSLTANPQEFQDLFEGASDTGVFNPADYGGTPVENAVLFTLPTEPFRASAAEDLDDTYWTRLPTHALDRNGARREFTQGNPLVFRFLPDSLRQAGLIQNVDQDDRMFYQFDVNFRRSVARSSEDDPAVPGRKLPLRDLYVAQVRVYKGFVFDPNVINDPYFEWDFYINVTR
jgi:prepilin-type N-terminal cleavage/methylation domain-containing protein